MRGLLHRVPDGILETQVFDGWKWVTGRETDKVMRRGGRVEPGGRSLKKNNMIDAHSNNLPNANGGFLWGQRGLWQF